MHIFRLLKKHLNRLKKKDKYFKYLMKKAKKEAYGKSKE